MSTEATIAPDAWLNVVLAMAEISPTIAALSDESVNALALEAQAIGLPARDAMLRVRAISMHHQAGKARPLAGDFLRDLRATKNQPSGGPVDRSRSPRDWSDETKARLARMHPNATGQLGPVGPLRALFDAGNITESQCLAMMKEAAAQNGEWVERERPVPNMPVPDMPGDGYGKRYVIDQPAATAYFNELVLQLVRDNGHDPEAVLAEWRRGAGMKQ